MAREHDTDGAVRPMQPADENRITPLELRLRHYLFRVLCPGVDELLAFQQRTADPDRYIAIAEHLQLCEHCQHELQILEQIEHQPLRITTSLGAILFPPHRPAAP